MIDYLPSIAQQILDTAWSQLEDADYENHARVIIGNDMVLVDKDEFEELKAVSPMTATCRTSQRLYH